MAMCEVGFPNAALDVGRSAQSVKMCPVERGGQKSALPECELNVNPRLKPCFYYCESPGFRGFITVGGEHAHISKEEFIDLGSTLRPPFVHIAFRANFQWRLSTVGQLLVCFV